MPTEMTINEIRKYLDGKHYGLVASAMKHGRIPEMLHDYVLRYKEVSFFVREWLMLSEGMSYPWCTGRISKRRVS